MYLNVAQIAERLHVSYERAKKLITEGKLPSLPTNGSRHFYKVDEKAVNDYKRSLKVAAEETKKVPAAQVEAIPEGFVSSAEYARLAGIDRNTVHTRLAAGAPARHDSIPHRGAEGEASSDTARAQPWTPPAYRRPRDGAHRSHASLGSGHRRLGRNLMKRFYCTTCQRVVRVRTMPNDLHDHETVERRTGTCRHHGAQVSRDAVNDCTRVQKVHAKKPKAQLAIPKPKR